MRERLQKMLGERTLVLIKPDAVKRGLVGIIFQRFEQTGLKVVACKLVFPNRRLLDGHFPKSENWVRGMGEKTLETYHEYGIDPVEIFGTNDPLAIGRKIKEWNYHYLTLGPVMVMVLQGIHAVDTVRKLIGHTLPYKAAAGTIRGDFSINAADLANVVEAPAKTLCMLRAINPKLNRRSPTGLSRRKLFPGNEPTSSCTSCKESSQPSNRRTP